MGYVGFDDPLNEILLPALDVAKRLKSGERSGRSAEVKLAAALLVLAEEREAMRWLYQQKVAEVELAQAFTEVLMEEADAAAVERARSYMRLRNRTGVAS